MFYLARYIIRQVKGDDAQNTQPATRRERRRQRRDPNYYENNNYQQPTSYQPPTSYNNGMPQPHYDTSTNQPYTDPNTYPPTQHVEPKRPFWEVWGPRLRLMGAVFLPVILDTLDYTSKPSSMHYYSNTHASLKSSLLLKQTLLPSSTVSTCSRISVQPTSSVPPSFFQSGLPSPTFSVVCGPWKHHLSSF